MTESDVATLRLTVAGEIVAHTVFLAGRLGKAALGRLTLEVMAKVPRHALVRRDVQPFTYANTPLHGGCGKTISQPFIVELMTDLLDQQPSDVVLEVGTGPGYQTAVLAYQLKRGGRMVIPSGLADEQQLLPVEKTSSDTVSTRKVLPVQFSQLEAVEAGMNHAGHCLTRMLSALCRRRGREVSMRLSMQPDGCRPGR